MSCDCCDCCDCTTDTTDCASLCTALTVTNAWNVPSCNNSAVLAIPGISVVLLGSYIYNPTYGWFKITAVDSINSQITVLNECLYLNASPGSVVPAGTSFVFGPPPGSTNVSFYGEGTGTNYTLTNVSTPVTFGTNQAAITLTAPGTYLIMPVIMLGAAGMSTAGGNVVGVSLNRQNNTPATIATARNIWKTAPDASVDVYDIFPTYPFSPTIYTTLNSNDIININAYYTGVLLTGTLEITAGTSITAIKFV